MPLAAWWRDSDPVLVRDFLGRSKLSTTDRYVSAKLGPEGFAQLDAALGVTGGTAAAGEVDAE